METHIKDDLRVLPKMLVGLIALSFGIFITKEAHLGLNAWGVFHDGISIVTGMAFGTVIQLLGGIILLISIVFKIASPGIGTILNMLFVGYLINVFDSILEFETDILWIRSSLLVFGVLITAFGRATYITCRLGKGPRDGLFVGLVRITGIRVAYIKPLIEITILVIGFLLGGEIGVGTVLTALLSGLLVERYFKLYKYDPSIKDQSTFAGYYKEYRHKRELHKEKNA